MTNAQAGLEARDEVFEARKAALEKAGLTFDYLTKKLKSELNAKITKTSKLKGAVADPVPQEKGIRILSRSGLVIETKDGEMFGDGDTVIAWEEIDWSTRQAARKDAHQLRGDYPSKDDKEQRTDRLGELLDAFKAGPIKRGETYNAG